VNKCHLITTAAVATPGGPAIIAAAVLQRRTKMKSFSPQQVVHLLAFSLSQPLIALKVDQLDCK
jgi:hypothetical protein